MAARSDDPDVSPESSSPAAAAGREIWGTLEELLLACAVSRHGTASWESVAMEVQSRSPSAAARLTPTSCRLRFSLLHRRFAAGAGEDGGGGEPDATASAAADAWVEELRKLRVAELRREVERYDLSIGSLQSKVKRLKEERERSLSGETENESPALKEVRETDNESPDEAGGENGVSGEASARSCKESNSSDLKPPPGDDSGGAADDGNGDAEVKDEPAAGEVDVKDEASGESAAGSKEADAEKESSDVQSSASPSRRRRRRLRKVGGDDVASTSAPVALPAAEAEPLLAFLESIRTSKSGAVFERRLESQESGKYRGTIRRHVDLEIIRSRLESGGAAGGAESTCYASASEFYRDLLLLCANALVFFPRGSPEHAAATRTRAVVSKRISTAVHRDGLGTAGKAAAGAVVGGGSSADGAKKAKTDAEVAGSLLEKAAPIIVCRKRSSIAKAAAAAANKGVIVEEEDTEDDEEFDEGKKKGSAKDKGRGMRTNKGRGPARNAAQNQKTGKASESAAEGTKKSDKKGGGTKPAAAAAGGVINKRNAVDFLKRMKQNSVPSTERVSLLETLKLSATEQKKAAKADGRKEPGSSSGSKKAAAAAETASGGRRSVGRPPKRAAAPPTPPPSKRAKDDRPTRKRGKK